MKALMLPILLTVVGAASGAGAGFFLRPDPPAPVTPDGQLISAPTDDGMTDESSEPDYARLNNQFIVPLVSEDGVNGIVVLSLTVEVEAGQMPTVFEQEPKLRDAFIEALFRHANTGGFDGVYTEAVKMNALRIALRDQAQVVLGDIALGVLVTDIVRQER